MVLQKRLDYGFNGYQVPPVPRATRSARRRRCFKKGSEDNQVCPFDLLALVAGNLLLEKDSNPSSGNISANEDQFAFASDNVQNKWQDEGKPGKVEAHDHENPARNFYVSKHVSQVHAWNSSSKENDVNLGLASPITNSNCMERVNVEKLVNSKRKDDMGTPNSNVEVALSSYMECCDCKLKDQTTRLIKDELHGPAKVLNNSESVMCSSDDPEVCNRKPAPVSLHSSAKGPLHGNNLIPNTSCPVIQDNVNVVSRDDDENSSGCTHTSTTKKFLRSAPRIRDRRIRKILASKYWKVAPKLKDATLSKIDGDWRSAYCNWKNSYKYQGSEKLYPLKKRKHFGGYNSPSNSDGGISSESFSGSLRQCNSGDASGSFQKMHRATGPSVVGQNTPFQPRDSHVKLRIKSFRVPELFIEIPESGTIGSLKRAVMETVTAVLGGGLRVGVLLQGKKVRDDNKTLLQTGISHHNQLDALGFSLEPNHPKPSASLHPGDSLFLLPCEAPQPLSRCSPTTVAGHPGTCATSAELHAANSGNLVQSNHDSAPSPTDISVDNSTTNSKALVTVPAMNVEALAVAPAHQKHKRSEIAQRRIRRPFSVAEVEALVQAVEKLGTGRWRDVKLQAFDDAKHRTYVDLKDKWKTLVHTARISPQQRRGEPVPQELLDRVLTAHAYWSQQQAKHQLKRQLPETCLLL